MICSVSSGTAHHRHKPLPGPFCLATSTPEGRRSRRSCHTKIFILRGIGAFHRWDVQLRSGPLNRALQVDLTENVPDRDRPQWALSELPGRTPGSRARKDSRPRVSQGWGPAETGQPTHQPQPPPRGELLVLNRLRMKLYLVDSCNVGFASWFMHLSCKLDCHWDFFSYKLGCNWNFSAANEIATEKLSLNR